MEYDYDTEKLGGGIITLSVLHFIVSFFSILGGIILLVSSSNSSLSEQLASLNVTITPSSIIFEDIILRLVLVASLILILRKNKIGIYGYFLWAIISIISSIIFSGFDITSLIISLVFPILMAIFILKKKSLFGFEE